MVLSIDSLPNQLLSSICVLPEQEPWSYTDARGVIRTLVSALARPRNRQTTLLTQKLTGNSPPMTLVSNYASSTQLSREASETTSEATLSACIQLKARIRHRTALEDADSDEHREQEAGDQKRDEGGGEMRVSVSVQHSLGEFSDQRCEEAKHSCNDQPDDRLGIDSECGDTRGQRHVVGHRQRECTEGEKEETRQCDPEGEKDATSRECNVSRTDPDSDADPDTLQEILDAAETGSPMYDNILNGVPISANLETASPAGNGAA